MPIANPYAPPASDLAPTIPPAPDRRSRGLWAVGFGVNLVVPVLFATMMLSPLGWAGLIAASWSLLALGLAILASRPAWTWPATTGAFLVAATQLLPILQIGVGMVSVALACSATGGRSPLVDDDSGKWSLGAVAAFLATTLGGLALMGSSLIVGLLVEAIWVRPRGR